MKTRALLLCAAGLVVALAGTAGATIRNSGITCTGSASITNDDGKVYPVSGTDAKATVPRNGVATYTGAVRPATHDHQGEVVIDLGLVKIRPGTWGPSQNKGNGSTKTGTYQLPAAFKYVPPGEYTVSGFHAGKEGRCEGEVVIDVEGTLVDNPVGLVSLAVTGVSAAALLSAGWARP